MDRGGLRWPDTCVGYDDIDSSEMFFSLDEEVLNVIFLPYVGANSDTIRGKFGRKSLDSREVTLSAEDKLCPLSSEAPRASRTDAPGSARHQHDFTV